MNLLLQVGLALLFYYLGLFIGYRIDKQKKYKKISKKVYVVYQSVIVSETFNNGKFDTGVNTIIRLVDAIDKKDAIGWFVQNTKDIKVKQKLDIECLEVTI